MSVDETASRRSYQTHNKEEVTGGVTVTISLVIN